VRVLETKLAGGPSNGAPGTILERGEDGVLVQCGDGAILVLRTEPVA